MAWLSVKMREFLLFLCEGVWLVDLSESNMEYIRSWQGENLEEIIIICNLGQMERKGNLGRKCTPNKWNGDYSPMYAINTKLQKSFQEPGRDKK